MTFTMIEKYEAQETRYSLDIEDLDVLYTIGHDWFGDAPMTIDWASLTITVTLG